MPDCKKGTFDKKEKRCKHATQLTAAQEKKQKANRKNYEKTGRAKYHQRACKKKCGEGKKKQGCKTSVTCGGKPLKRCTKKVHTVEKCEKKKKTTTKKKVTLPSNSKYTGLAVAVVSTNEKKKNPKKKRKATTNAVGVRSSARQAAMQRKKRKGRGKSPF